MSVITCSECQFSNASDAKVCRKCKFPFDGDWPSLVGQTVGNYELTRRVGGGGFGAVYHAKHVTLGNSFAVKILHPTLAEEETFIERFQQEAYVLAELRHENVVQVIDFGFLEGVGFYLITEWLEGRNLYRIWRRHNNLDRGWLLALFSQLLDALAYAHERGIVHRDLKPENLMLTRGARNRILLKIVDFGIAQIVERGAKRDAEEEGPEKRSSMAVGTPYYMAPEQVQGLVEQIGPRTDLYACGIILLEMLTGQRVFEAEGHRNIMRLQLEAIPPTLHELKPSGAFSEGLQEVIDQALNKLPEERFPDAQTFYQMLESAMDGMDVEPVWEDIYRVHEPQGKPAHREPRPSIEYRTVAELQSDSSVVPAIILGFVFMFAILVGGFLFLQTLQSKQTKKTVRKAPVRRIIAKGWDRFTAPKKRTPEVRILNIAPQTVDAGDVPQKRPAPRRTSKTHRRRMPRFSSKRRRPTAKRIVKKQTSIKKGEPKRAAPTPKKKVLFSLSLQTVPSGGIVYVDKKAVGKTPIMLRSEQGRKLKVRIKMDGKVDFKYIWRVRKNIKVSHQFIEDL